jgi:hypothetical protein
MMAGEASTRGGRKYGPEDYTHMNQVPGYGRYTKGSPLGLMHSNIAHNFTPKREKWFASKALFDRWWADIQQKRDSGQIRDAEWKVIRQFKVAVQEDGSVIVYREINTIPGYQPDGDRLVAINGLSYRPINAKRRKGAAANDMSMTQYRKATTGINSEKALNVHTIISKIVATAARRAGLSGTRAEGQWKVKEFAAATNSYYKPIKAHVLGLLVGAYGKKFGRTLGAKPMPGEVHSEKERVEKKLVADPEFRALALGALGGCSFGREELLAAVRGQEQGCGDVSGFVDEAFTRPQELLQRAVGGLAQLGILSGEELSAVVFGGARPSRTAGALMAPAMDPLGDDDDGAGDTALFDPLAGGSVPGFVQTDPNGIL